MKVTILLLAVLVLFSGVECSHFRGSFISYTVTGTRQVEITISHAWRSSALDSLGVYFGDGGYQSVSGSNIFTGTDQAGEGYTVLKVVLTHTYPGTGPYTLYFSNCCRVGTLQNGAGASFQVTTVIDLRGNAYSSPIASIPPLLQFPISATGSYKIGVADPNGLGYTCSLTPTSSSYISSNAAIGNNVLSVTSDCTIVWNTAAGVKGNKYAVGITIAQATTSTTVPLDFIIELVNAGQKPTCSVSSTSSQVTVGQTWTASITGTSTSASSLKITALGLASHATLSPASGSSGAVPLTTTLTAVPTAPGAYSTVILFTDPSNVQTSCTVAYQVVAPSVDCSVLTYTACTLNTFSLSATTTSSVDSYSWRSNCSGSFDANNAATAQFTTNDGPNTACNVTVDINVASVVASCSKTVFCPICSSSSGSSPCRNDRAAVYTVSDAASIDKYLLSDVLATVADPDGTVVAAIALSTLPPGVGLTSAGKFVVINTALLDDGTYPVNVTTYDVAGGATTQTVVIVLLAITCGDGQQSCGYQCYNPDVHSCITFDGHRHLCVKGQRICSFQDNCCYDPATQDCYNGTLCPKGNQLCNKACYNPNNRACLTTSTGEQTLCIRGYQLCGGDCFDPNAFSCTNGLMCLKSEQVCGNGCFDPNAADCLNGMLVPKGYQQCGPATFNPQVYGCFNGHTLCPVPTQLCGGACYNPQDHSCQPDFTLCPAKNERCGMACFDESAYTCCDTATSRIVQVGQAC